MRTIKQVTDTEITKYYQPKPTPKPNPWKSIPNLTPSPTVSTTEKIVNVTSKALGLDRLHNYLAFKAPRISLPTIKRCPHCGK